VRYYGLGEHALVAFHVLLRAEFDLSRFQPDNQFFDSIDRELICDR
jgi:hypothetical protein